MKYIAPMSWPAVVTDPNHFSKIGATSPERYRLASARLTDSLNAASAALSKDVIHNRHDVRQTLA